MPLSSRRVLLRIAVAALAVVAYGAGAPTAHTAAGTPYLDAVEQALREVSPGLEHSVWERSEGNELHSLTGNPEDGIISTPGCWGDPTCASRPGTEELLQQIRDNIAAAERTVDIVTLSPPPDGPYRDAIVDGLRLAAERGHRLQVRILLGGPPAGGTGLPPNPMELLALTGSADAASVQDPQRPSAYLPNLMRQLGTAGERHTFNVAAVTTSVLSAKGISLSWNHSKLVIADGNTVLTGGSNFWSGDYYDTGNPVTDSDIALRGPAAASATRFVNELWGWTCAQRGTTFGDLVVWLAASPGASCMANLEPSPVASGTVPVLAVGALGLGIKDRDDQSRFQRPAPKPQTCFPWVIPDLLNSDRDTDTVNPDTIALHALIARAEKRVDISQMDLLAKCPPLPGHDTRLFAILAEKIVAGVNVRIVVSDPRSGPSLEAPLAAYSQINSLRDVWDALRPYVASRTTPDRVLPLMREHLELASFRESDAPAWANGRGYALHDKVVAVDDAAFYLGSKNLYPTWLQEYGFIVEDAAAVRALHAKVLAPQWRYSQATRFTE